MVNIIDFNMEGESFFFFFFQDRYFTLAQSKYYMCEILL